MSKVTILIIDDEQSIRLSLASFLEDEGFLVLTAQDGKEGLEIFFDKKVDIVITDLRMPEKDGIEVMKTIHARSPEVPMIVISGAGKKEDIINALRMGAKDYITKPVDDLNIISHVINRVLENARLSRENRQYKEQLEKSEKQYRTITENIAEGVFTADEDENLTYINKAMCDILGYTKDELVNKNLKELSTKEGFKLMLEQTKIRRTGVSNSYEVPLLHKDKTLVYSEFACSPFFGEGGSYKGTIVLIRDITNLITLRKKYEKFIKHRKGNPEGLITICASCKNIRDKNGEWIVLEEYFSDKSFSHGICNECCEKLYPELDFENLE